MAQLTAEARHILNAQTIDDDGPGTILHDFEALLGFIGAQGTAVSSKNNLLPMGSLAQLNAQMAHPIQLALKRPLQRSYPLSMPSTCCCAPPGWAASKGPGANPP